MNHSHDTDRDKVPSQMLAALVLNTIFTLIEIVGGFLTNSVAILSDAMHDLGDSLALGMAWYFERLSHRGRDKSHTYGYRRYSVLGAIINAIVLITGSLFVIREAVERVFAPEYVNAPGMIILAILGVIINGLAFSRLHAGHSQNAEVIRLHLLEDVLGWIVVLIGAIVIQVWSLYILDPILSILVSAWILYHVIKRLRKSVHIMLQNTPIGINTQAVDQMIRAIPGVLNTHDTHLWTMDGEYHILTMHVVMEDKKSLEEQAQLKDTIRKHLSTQHIQHVTIEFESSEEPCVHADC